jgi:hypothetical protein
MGDTLCIGIGEGTRLSLNENEKAKTQVGRTKGLYPEKRSKKVKRSVRENKECLFWHQTANL